MLQSSRASKAEDAGAAEALETADLGAHGLESSCCLLAADSRPVPRGPAPRPGRAGQRRVSQERRPPLSRARIRTLENVLGRGYRRWARVPLPPVKPRPVPDSWYCSLSLLHQYVAAVGALPLHNTVYQGFGLGSWCAAQQRSHRSMSLGPLPAEKQRALEEVPRWTWRRV